MPLQKTRRLRGRGSEQRAGRAVAAERRQQRGEADADAPRLGLGRNIEAGRHGDVVLNSLLLVAHAFGLRGTSGQIRLGQTAESESEIASG